MTSTAKGGGGGGGGGNGCVVRVVVTVVMVMVMMVGVTRGQGLDYRAWLGEEPITIKRAVEELVEYFSARDPHGIPILEVPDVIHIPDSVPVRSLTFYNPSVSGHSQLRLETIIVNLTSLTATARVSLPWIIFHGDYLWEAGFLGTSEGYGNVTMLGMEIVMDLDFGVDDEGALSAIPKIDLLYDDLQLHFTGLSTYHWATVSLAETFFSTIIQPLIFSQVQTRFHPVLNEKIEKLLKNRTFPDSISPVDFAVSQVRLSLRQRGKDPLLVEDRQLHLAWGVTVLLQNIELAGLSSIHRTHEISAQVIDSTIYATVQLGTLALEGGVDWSLSASLLPAVGGRLSLGVEKVAVTVEVQQPLNIRSPPTLRKIDIQLGNFGVRSEGEGTLDYVVEALVNILPNLLRNQIMDKVEVLLHKRIQKEFNRLDLYRLVMTKLESMDRS